MRKVVSDQWGYYLFGGLTRTRRPLPSVLAKAIAATTEPTREALALAFSGHLTTNCMLTQYAFGWRRLAPLFSIRAYRHVSRPVNATLLAEVQREVNAKPTAPAKE